MKKITLILTLVAGLFIFLSSCQKVEKDPVMDLNLSTPASFTSPERGTVIVLLLADSANPFVMNWNAATYSVSNDAAVPETNYTLQVGLADSNFVGAKELSNTKVLTYETIVYSLNNFLLSLGIPGDSTATIELRIISAISGAAQTSDTSAVITMTVTTFSPPVPPPPDETPHLWVPGDYQGWNPGAAPNVWSPANDGVYKGYVYYPEGGTFEFKFTAAPDWDHTNFGFGSEGTLSTDPGAGNLSVAEFGNYFLTCDTVNLTWTNEIRNFTLIGSFNEWAGDAELTWDNTNRMFTITMDFAAGAEVKWRANADWAVNFGDSGAGDNTLSQDGANIVLTDAGNYTLNLYLEKEVPTYEVIKN